MPTNQEEIRVGRLETENSSGLAGVAIGELDGDHD